MSTSIEWTDATWNPVRGCTRVSEGCRHCYAETMAARNLPEMRSPTTGKAFAQQTPQGPRWTGKVELIPSKLDEPLLWRKPQRVFVNSMSDLFHESLSDAAIDDVVRVMGAARRHTFQILTKRPKRMLEYVARRWDSQNPNPIWRPLPNVWLGVSVEDQATADERIPLLLQTPAAVRFVSYEPALGKVWWPPFLYLPLICRDCGKRDAAHYDPNPHGLPNHPLRPNGCLLGAPNTGEPGALRCNPCGSLNVDELPTLDWIIVGGESGPGARPFDLAWARATVEQCKAAGVPVFVKQLGSRWAWAQRLIWTTSRGKAVQRLRARSAVDPKGGDPAEWPENLRIREFPHA